MNKYAKIINEKQIEIAPDCINKDGFWVTGYNLDSNEVMLLVDGYKPLIMNEVSGEMRQPEVRYRDLGESIEVYYVDTYLDPVLTYEEKRVAEYPPMADFLDAQVKINSGDEKLMAEGQEQLSAYYTNCLAVKAKYPKE